MFGEFPPPNCTVAPYISVSYMNRKRERVKLKLVYNSCTVMMMFTYYVQQVSP